MSIDPTLYDAAWRLFGLIASIAFAFVLCGAFLVTVAHWVIRRELRDWIDEALD